MNLFALLRKHGEITFDGVFLLRFEYHKKRIMWMVVIVWGCVLEFEAFSISLWHFLEILLFHP